MTELRLTLLVLQCVHGLLILILEHFDKAVWHDFATPIFTHLSHNNVIETSSEKGALPAHHSELDTHVLASLLNGQVAFPVDADDRDCGVQAPTSSDGRDNCAG